MAGWGAGVFGGKQLQHPHPFIAKTASAQNK
jgi:hypothetical protein